jgi:DNA-binding transcriptional regulator YiaG
MIMKCLKCNNDRFIEKKMSFNPLIKEEIVEVIIPCMTCSKCRFPLMNAEQMNLLRKTAADKYKELHGLLTSSQIIARREELGMTQSAFASHLNFEETSIKKWETYYVQDASEDARMKLR